MAAECVERLLAFPLPSVSKDAPILLGKLPAERRVAEMEFSLPVGRSVTTGAAPHPNDRLSVDKLIGVLSRFGFSVGYLERLDTLGFAAWAGFLRGFIDLVYEWEGRLYALDYKSNYLGAHYSDYRMPGLHQAMEDHHYLLQALIYCVAVHRYGKQRIADYEYERHFGGMQYVFLRGIGPDPGAGVYWFRPQPELVVALDSLFDDPALSRPVDFGTIAGDTKFSAPGMDSGRQAR
jgi:exodeoxyribonuclease V beta subunit